MRNAIIICLLLAGCASHPSNEPDWDHINYAAIACQGNPSGPGCKNAPVDIMVDGGHSGGHGGHK